MYFQPVVAGGRVVVHVYDDGLYALDAVSGEVAWDVEWEADDAWMTASDGVVYASGGRQVQAVDATTGEVRWTYGTGPIHYSVPAVAEGIVYVADWGNHLHAVDQETGELQWKHEAESGFRSAPVVAGGAVYIFSREGTLHALDAATGELLWQYGVDDAYYESPGASGGLVYISSDEAMFAVAADTGEPVWQSEQPGSGDSRMTIADGVLYFYGQNGTHAVDALTGDPLWTYGALGALLGAGTGAAPAVEDGVAYLGSVDGLHAVDAATGELLWQYGSPPPLSASVAADGAVYYGALDDHVYALSTAADVPDPDPTPTPTPVSGVVKLIAGESGLLGVFGFAVAASRDGGTIAVGDSAGETERKYDGTVSVFERNGPQWSDRDESSAAILESPDDNDWEPVPDDRDWVELTSSFGSAVAMSADGATIVVGAPDQLPHGYDSGAVHVFTRPEGGWGAGTAQAATLTASEGTSNSRFGSAVAISADGQTIAVGSTEFRETGRRGAVYVFARPDAGWSDTHETARLMVSGYGSVRSVAVSADGATIVGGQSEDFGRTEPFSSYAGSVYVFERPGPGWEETNEAVRLWLPDGMEEDHFGFSLAITDDAGTVVVGAPGRDDYARDHGAVFLFSQPTTGWADAGEPVLLTASDGARADFFGASVAVSTRGDVVVVGAQKQDFGAGSAGAAYVFGMPEDGWADANETVKLVNPGGTGIGTIFGGGVFGRETGVAGDTIIIGTPGVAVYLFDAASLLPRS